MSFHTYLLRCNDGSYYAGHTDNLEPRLALHHSGVLRGYTHSRRPLRLVWLDTFPTRDEAFQAERQIKGLEPEQEGSLDRQGLGAGAGAGSGEVT